MKVSLNVELLGRPGSYLSGGWIPKYKFSSMSGWSVKE